MSPPLNTQLHLGCRLLLAHNNFPYNLYMYLHTFQRKVTHSDCYAAVHDLTVNYRLQNKATTSHACIKQWQCVTSPNRHMLLHTHNKLNPPTSHLRIPLHLHTVHTFSPPEAAWSLRSKVAEMLVAVGRQQGGQDLPALLAHLLAAAATHTSQVG